MRSSMRMVLGISASVLVGLAYVGSSAHFAFAGYGVTGAAGVGGVKLDCERIGKEHVAVQKAAQDAVQAYKAALDKVTKVEGDAKKAKTAHEVSQAALTSAQGEESHKRSDYKALQVWKPFARIGGTDACLMAARKNSKCISNSGEVQEYDCLYFQCGKQGIAREPLPLSLNGQCESKNPVPDKPEFSWEPTCPTGGAVMPSKANWTSFNTGPINNIDSSVWFNTCGDRIKAYAMVHASLCAAQQEVTAYAKWVSDSAKALKDAQAQLAAADKAKKEADEKAQKDTITFNLSHDYCVAEQKKQPAHQVSTQLAPQDLKDQKSKGKPGPGTIQQ